MTELRTVDGPFEKASKAAIAAFTTFVVRFAALSMSSKERTRKVKESGKVEKGRGGKDAHLTCFTNVNGDS